MSGLLLFLLSFAGYFIYFSKLSFEASVLPIAILSSIVTFLYAASLVGVLLPGAYIVASVGLILGITTVYKARKDIKTGLAPFNKPGFVLFFIAAILFWLKLSMATYSMGDEFTHWGFMVKEMSLRNSLPPANSALLFLDYPPGTAIFQYYLSIFTGWSEGATYVAQAMLLLSAALCLLKGLAWKNWVKMLAIFSFFYFAIYIFGHGVLSLLVDTVLGVLFGAAIFSYFRSDLNGSKRILQIAPILFVLPLIKACGFLLALIAATIIATDQIYGLCFSGSKAECNKRRILICISLCALVFLAPILSKRSWDWHVKRMGVGKIFETNYSLSRINKSFSWTEATSRDQKTLAEFKRVFLSSQINPRYETNTPNILMAKVFSTTAYPLTARNWLLMFILLSLAGILLETRHEKRRQNISIFAWMLLGFCGYAFGLLLLYLYSFSEYEGIRAASFTRYVAIYFVGWIYVVFGLVLRSSEQTVKAGRIATMLIASIIIGVFYISPPEAMTLIRRKYFNPMSDIRDDIHRKVQNLPEALSFNKKVYIVWQNSAEHESYIEPWILAYELAPRVASPKAAAPWSFGSPYSPRDIWTMDWALETWSAALKDYDFVILGRTDQTFWNKFSKLFEANAQRNGKTIFVVTITNGKVKLI